MLLLLPGTVPWYCNIAILEYCNIKGRRKKKRSPHCWCGCRAWRPSLACRSALPLRRRRAGAARRRPASARLGGGTPVSRRRFSRARACVGRRWRCLASACTFAAGTLRAQGYASPWMDSWRTPSVTTLLPPSPKHRLEVAMQQPEPAAAQEAVARSKRWCARVARSPFPPASKPALLGRRVAWAWFGVGGGAGLLPRWARDIDASGSRFTSAVLECPRSQLGHTSTLGRAGLLAMLFLAAVVVMRCCAGYCRDGRKNRCRRIASLASSRRR